jgi:EmrB/QacA subfamily drug resistance transporter
LSTALLTPSKDAAPIPGETVAHPRMTLIATILASSLAFIDGSVVNVALPSIAHSYGAHAAALQWTINAYLLPLSALLLIGGAAGDHFGRRRLFIAGIAVFALASICCALAPNLAMLLTARAGQGIGAAMLMPNSLAILSDAFSGPARGRAIGTWAAVGAIAAAIGPPLGGWLIETAGWRSIFFLNIPIALAAVIIAWRSVDESSTAQRSLDWGGALLATAALGALTWGLTLWSSARAVDPGVWTALFAGVILLGGFLMVERSRGDQAMMPLLLFGSPVFVGLTILTFLLYAALGGLFVLLPYALIVAGGYSPLHAGMALLPLPALIGIGSRLMGRTAEWIGPRWPLTIGALIVGFGFALLVRFHAAASYWSGVLPGAVVIALGMAAIVAPLTTAVLSAVDRRYTGTASGFNNAIARTGGMIATALAGSVIALGGDDLVRAFHAAAWIGAGLAAVSALTAFLTLGRPRSR